MSVSLKLLKLVPPLFDENNFVNDLSYIDWVDIINVHSPDHGWDSFLKHFLPVCDKHAPMKKIKVLS